MNLERSVLLVSTTSALTEALAPAILRAGHRLSIARNFHSGKSQLSDGPDLLITELKLDEYNGLQLALRSRTVGIPALVIADKSFEVEIEQLGAMWISPEAAASDDLPAVITQLLQGSASVEASDVWYSTADATDLSAVMWPSPHTTQTLH